MDSRNDAVIGVIKNYGWEALEPYVTSLVKTGFQGSKLMFVQNIKEDARLNLLSRGFIVVDFCSPENFSTGRFEPAVEYLRGRIQDFRYIIWTDVRDLIFQTDPSVWLEAHLAPQRILGCSECMLLKQERINGEWLTNVVGIDTPEHVRIREQEVLCSGTIAGEAGLVLDAFMKILEIGKDIIPRYPYWDGGSDQGIWNYVLRTSPFQEASRTPRMEEGFTASLNWFLVHDYGHTAQGQHGNEWTDHAPVIDRATGLVYPEGKNEPFSIVHQFDRDPQWKVIVENRYRMTAVENRYRITTAPVAGILTNSLTASVQANLLRPLAGKWLSGKMQHEKV